MGPQMSESPFWAIVPAGGSGTRLWPLSRADAPKFLLDLTGSGRTLIQQTVDRLTPLAEDRVVVVTGVRHREAVGDQLPDLPPHRMLAEPLPRDSMAAIGWAAATIERVQPDAVVGSFAADHAIGDDAGFQECVREAIAVAATGRIVTLGITPTYPSTAFGYLRVGARLEDFPTAHDVVAFTEKPASEIAVEYVGSGDYRWNAGMFVAPATLLLDELARNHPAMAADLRAMAADPALVETRWPGLEAIAIDHAVAEPAASRGRVATVPGGFGWDDVGDFASLATLLPGDRVKVLGAADLVMARDSSGLVAPHDRPIAVIGLDDVVVIDAGDALLVTDHAHAQEVKEIVAALREAGRGELI